MPSRGGQPVEPKFLTYSKAPTEHKEPAPLGGGTLVGPTRQSEEGYHDEVPGVGGVTPPWAHRADRTPVVTFPGEHPLYPQVERLEGRTERLEWWLKLGIVATLGGLGALAFTIAVELGMFLALLARNG